MECADDDGNETWEEVEEEVEDGGNDDDGDGFRLLLPQHGRRCRALEQISRHPMMVKVRVIDWLKLRVHGIAVRVEKPGREPEVAAEEYTMIPLMI